MKQFLFVLFFQVVSLVSVAGECANGCSGHGKCTSYDMCICNRNWQGNDCSEKVCQFGTAHVDSPKGDLDMSGDISGPDNPVVDNSFAYPYGTTEQFPQMEDSDLNKLSNTAHYYMECSNKGVCDRTTGECTCYPGYDGAACQRASCPGYPASCSGHGVCKTKHQLAFADNYNVYKLWDKDSTMGCDCDPGYFGADCSLRQCKYGVDPLYLDDSALPIYSEFNLATLRTITHGLTETGVSALQFTDGTWQVAKAGTLGSVVSSNSGYLNAGHWAIRFYDSFGEDWLTEPIEAMASCAIVVDALENLPNNVIPKGSVKCSWADSTSGNSQSTWSTYDQTNGVYEDDGTNNANAVSDPSLRNHAITISYKMQLWDAYVNPLKYDSTFWTEGLLGSDNEKDDDGEALKGELYGIIYNLKFFGNPGALKEPEIEIYLNGKQPTLQASNPGDVVITKVWSDGKQGEYVDYFADHCDGVTFTLTSTLFTGDIAATITTNQLYTTTITPSSLTTAELGLLKACLGDSDFDTSNNRDVYNWDYGSKAYPHLVKIVKSVATSTDGGNYVALWYDPVGGGSNSNEDDDAEANANFEGQFVFFNPFTPDDGYSTDEYEIYTTKGTFALTSNASFAVVPFASKTIYTVNPKHDISDGTYAYDGDLSCEVGMNNAGKLEYITHCLNKSDIFTYLSWSCPACNSPHINLYTAERLHTSKSWSSYSQSTLEGEGGTSTSESTYMIHSITTDVSTNWAVGDRPKTHYFGANAAYSVTASSNDAAFYIYKFFPSEDSSYEYVAPCSNRGICAYDTGICQCFPGYTSDDCSIQNSIAL